MVIYIVDKLIYKTNIIISLQATEEEMFCNNDHSPAFKEFVELLGETVTLKGFEKYVNTTVNQRIDRGPWDPVNQGIDKGPWDPVNQWIDRGPWDPVNQGIDKGPLRSCKPGNR